MLLMGDEVLRSQGGNNNAYGQNNETSWFDWNQLDQQKDFLRFVQQIIHLVQDLHVFNHDEPLIATPQAIVEPAIAWHGVKLGQPDWSDNSHSLAFTLRYGQYRELLHVMFNAYWQPLRFELPRLPLGQHWKRIIDTARPAPEDFCAVETAPNVDRGVYAVGDRAAVVLMAIASS